MEEPQHREAERQDLVGRLLQHLVASLDGESLPLERQRLFLALSGLLLLAIESAFGRMRTSKCP